MALLPKGTPQYSGLDILLQEGTPQYSGLGITVKDTVFAFSYGECCILF